MQDFAHFRVASNFSAIDLGDCEAYLAELVIRETVARGIVLKHPKENMCGIVLPLFRQFGNPAQHLCQQFRHTTEYITTRPFARPWR